jgi:hypothetical protein
MLAIEAKKSELFYFELDKTDELSYAWQMRRFKPETPTDHENDSEMNPPCFKISNRDWWAKVLGMLQHNWALIEEGAGGSVTVYFFHDGEVGMGCYGYSRAQLKGRYAIVDSLDFDSVQLAKDALSRNGFRLHGDEELLGSDVKPRGNFYDVRAMEEGVYSRQGNWSN